MKIRHFGLLGNRNKRKKLTLYKALTNTKVLTKENVSPLAIIKQKSEIIIYNFIPSQNCLFIGEGELMSILLEF